MKLGGKLHPALHPTLWTVVRPGRGLVSTMGHPAGGRLLEGKVRGLRSVGVDVLVSLQTDEERVECDLVDEERVVLAAGIRYLCLPVVDGSVPSVDVAVGVVRPLCEAYVGGAHVVFHCWAGVGRSSLMAGLLLGMDGVAPGEAWGLISEVRGRVVPENRGAGGVVGGLAGWAGVGVSRGTGVRVRVGLRWVVAFQRGGRLPLRMVTLLWWLRGSRRAGAGHRRCAPIAIGA